MRAMLADTPLLPNETLSERLDRGKAAVAASAENRQRIFDSGKEKL